MTRRKLDCEKEVVLWKRKFFDEQKVLCSEGCSVTEKEVL